ncbi:MAG: hypothetical protein U0790_23755 [Isosphaeraceae bacterium]
MTPSDQRCGHCPVEPGLSCEGLRVRRFCALADPGSASYSPGYRDLLRRLAAAGEGTDPDRDIDDAPPTRGLAATVALLRRMHDCPDRTPRADCGCAGLARCARGRGRGGLVNHHNCLGCLAEG